MMKHSRLFAITAAAVLFCSCQSTRVYLRSQEQFYEDDALIEERTTVTRLDYQDEALEEFQKQTVVEDVKKHYYDLSDDYTVASNTNIKTVIHLFTAESEETSKSEYVTLTFSLVEAEITKATNATNLTVVGQKQMRLKDNVVMPYTDSNGKRSDAKGDSFSDEDEELFKTVSAKLIGLLKSSDDSEDAAPAGNKKTRTESYTEKIKVVSTPNQNYIAYSILGKPFVLLGSATWNILKCAGYALINFAGGYNLTSGNSSGEGALWKMPSYKKSKEKAAMAKAANKIQYYPEYHLPFTDNQITVDKYDKHIEVETVIEEGTDDIVAFEHAEYNNTMNVSLSAKADAASTAATAGLIGTVVTIPVSVVTWIGGAAIGIYGRMSN